jgi:hypothetical protein
VLYCCEQHVHDAMCLAHMIQFSGAQKVIVLFINLRRK